MPALKDALITAFPGQPPKLSKGVGVTSHHASVSFYEYEVRVIMSAVNKDRQRDMTLRLIQKMKDPRTGRLNKFILVDLRTQDPAELLKGIKECRARLLGTIFAIRKALDPPPDRQVKSVDDLFREDM